MNTLNEVYHELCRQWKENNANFNQLIKNKPMNISEEITKLELERQDREGRIAKDKERVAEINTTIRKLTTQMKKFEAILGNGQKGVAE